MVTNGRSVPYRNLVDRWSGARLVRILALTLGLIIGLYPSAATTAVETSSPTLGCSGAWSRTGTGRPVLVIDCRPGFATDHDRISIYPRQPVLSAADWHDSLNYSDSVWLFDAGSTGRASLVVDFHPNHEGPGVAADLYDDQDDDGSVGIAYRNGIPYSAESPYPTVRVVAPAGWWIKDGKVNFNLDLQVDGPVEAAFNSEQYLNRLKTDGTLDFLITVRDPRGQGSPDVELINAWPDAPDDWGIDRSQLMVNPNGNEAPITGYLFWPYLGTAFDLPRRSTNLSKPTASFDSLNGQPYGFVKGYGQSFPPIQVYWPAAKIAYVGEFVASRGNSSNWFLYSINRLGAGRSDANFENPFAFYDLANARDGYPDLQIRDEYYDPNDRFLDEGKLRSASDLIRYSWDQHHQHHWDFKVDLIGQHEIDSTVSLPILDVRTVPYSTYPDWVVDRSWDAADFVAVEAPEYWTSEGIYESFGVNPQLRDALQFGRQSNSPEPDVKNWPVGLRGELNNSLHDQPRLYFSAVDHKLHLLNARTGLWKLDGAREIRYENLGGAYLNTWGLFDNGHLEKTLAFVGSQLILTDQDSVRIKTVSFAPALFTAMPPTDHDTWVQLRDQLGSNRSSIAPDDFSAMFDQFPGVVQTLPSAVLSDLRTSSDGLSFALRLSAATPRGATWLSGLQPGAYRVTYTAQGGYSGEPMRIAPLRLSAVDFAGQRPTALQPVTVETTVQNPADESRTDVVIRFTVSDAGHVTHDLGSTTVSVPAGGSARARVTWTPPSSGTWIVGAASSTGASEVSAKVQVAEPIRGDSASLLAVSGVDGFSRYTVWAILGAAVLLAGLLGILLWRGSSTAHHDLADPERGND